MENNLQVYCQKHHIGDLTFEDGEYIFSYETTQNDQFPEGYLLSIIKKHFSKMTKT